MPVQLTLTIPDLPFPPAGYLLVAMEIRDREPHEKLPPDRMVFANSTDGYEQAAKTFLDRSQDHVSLACIAWFANKPLDDCKDGEERLVSVFDGSQQGWSEWRAEPVVQSRANKRTRPRGHLHVSQANTTPNHSSGEAA